MPVAASSAWSLTVPELSFFRDWRFRPESRSETRAGFSSELDRLLRRRKIAFTSAEFGPDSGRETRSPMVVSQRLFLPHALADRINDLTYLGYAERFYDDRSF